MEFLQQWARGLVALVVLMGLVELLLPPDSLKPYVRMVLGLLVIVALIRPILLELPGLRRWEPVLRTASESGFGQITEAGRSIQERGRIAAEEVIRENADLEEYIHRRIPESSDVRIRQDGRRVRVWLTRDASLTVEKNLLDLLAGLGWDRNLIEVNRDAG